MILSCKYRLLPNKAQHVALTRILEDQRHLYNAALQERIDCYRKTGKSITYADQCRSLTAIRKADAEFAALPARLQRGTLRRLDQAFSAFFRRVRAGEKPGYPRFRGKDWFSSFRFSEWQGIDFDGKRFRWAGLPGGLRVHLHRPLPSGQLRSVGFKREVSGWSVSIAIEVTAPEKVAITNSVGMDVGLKTLAYLSDGVVIPNPRPARRAERELRRRQRALARCKRGSKERARKRLSVARLHRKIAETRRTYLHQTSAMLVKTYDLIAVEDLNVKGLARGMFAKSVHDASWSTLFEMVTYKAEYAGKHLVRVDPRFTTQACSGCGAHVPKTIAVRTHSCPECGLVIDRDWNAARNILKAVAGLGQPNVGR